MSDLPTLLAVLVFIFGAGAGALGVRLLRSWARPRQQPDSGSVGLAEAAARLDGRVSGIHSLVTDLLREQTTAGERLAVVGEQAAELHQTLASHQRRGAWGELLAEDVLRCAGLLDGIHYAKQRTLANGARPDFTFFVADGRTLHLDAKFPLANFRLMEQAESDSERESARKSFLADIRRHVKAVVDRGYADPASTVGFTVVFFSNPSVFAAIAEADPSLYEHALERHVVLADAGTLVAILMLVKSASDALRVQRRTMDVLRIITEFRGEWGKFTEHLDACDKKLATFLKGWEALNGTRRRQLQRRLDRIDGLEVPDGPSDETVVSSPDAPAALPEAHRSDRPQAAA